MRGRLPLIGHLPLAQQVRILGAALLLFIVLATVLVWQDLVGTRNNATHISGSRADAQPGIRAWPGRHRGRLPAILPP
jgi:hypothetical protein